MLGFLDTLNFKYMNANFTEAYYPQGLDPGLGRQVLGAK